MKKIFLLILLLLLLFSYTEEDVAVFSYIEDEIYDNYTLIFDECDLNTNNFIHIFSFFDNKDFKILEITPYKNYDNKFLYYSNNLENIINKFKNDYIDILTLEDKYVSNICINKVKINTSNYVLNDFKSIIYFEYLFSTKNLFY